MTGVAVAAVFAAAAVAVPTAGAAAPSKSPGALFAQSCKNQSKQRAPGISSTSYAKCFRAMMRLAQAKSRSPLMACATLSRKRIKGTRGSSPFRRCVVAGRTLTRRGNGIDLFYVEQMIPHHVMAVEMAQYALVHGESEYIRNLSANIISSQNVEIATMRKIAAQLRAAGIRTVSMGLTAEQMGMNHDMSHIVGARPFDPVFVDMMIPHHQGAITMSEVLFRRGTGTRTRALAEQIVASQAREIQEMRSFRMQSTGSASPAPGEGGGHPH
jgi:uncharacterized protein (DUF305 family)